MTETARRYAGQSAEERDAQRLERLREACLELIGTQGYAATTIEQICTTAGVSTRHFYLHHANKEAAFADLYEGMVLASSAAAAASLVETDGRPIVERIPHAFMAYLNPMVEDRRAARVAFVEIMGVSPKLEEVRLGYREALVAMIVAEGAAAVARGEVADRDFRFAGIALAGAATSVVYDWMVHPDPMPVAQLEDGVAELALTLLAR